MGYELINLSNGKSVYFSRKIAEMLLSNRLLNELENIEYIGVKNNE